MHSRGVELVAMLSVLQVGVVSVALEARYVKRGPVVLVERCVQLETL